MRPAAPRRHRLSQVLGAKQATTAPAAANGSSTNATRQRPPSSYRRRRQKSRQKINRREVRAENRLKPRAEQVELRSPRSKVKPTKTPVSMRVFERARQDSNL